MPSLEGLVVNGATIQVTAVGHAHVNGKDTLKPATACQVCAVLR
jgi:hypothetical protein